MSDQESKNMYHMFFDIFIKIRKTRRIFPSVCLLASCWIVYV